MNVRMMILLVFCALGQACKMGTPSPPSGVYACVYEAKPGERTEILGFDLGSLAACPYQYLYFLDESTVLVGAFLAETPVNYTWDGELLKLANHEGMAIFSWPHPDSLQGISPVKSRYVWVGNDWEEVRQLMEGAAP